MWITYKEKTISGSTDDQDKVSICLTNKTIDLDSLVHQFGTKMPMSCLIWAVSYNLKYDITIDFDQIKRLLIKIVYFKKKNTINI